MKSMIQTILSLLLVVSITSLVLAQEPFIYPNKGQSKEQTEKDKYSCYQWAKQESGFEEITFFS